MSKDSMNDKLSELQKLKVKQIKIRLRMDNLRCEATTCLFGCLRADSLPAEFLRNSSHDFCRGSIFGVFIRVLPSNWLADLCIPIG